MGISAKLLMFVCIFLEIDHRHRISSDLDEDLMACLYFIEAKTALAAVIQSLVVLWTLEIGTGLAL